MTQAAPELDLTVLGEIASGGMGAVELARLTDPDGERFVAVKRMHPEYSRDQEFVRMFRDEIWLTGSLCHPNVVGLVGFGEDDDGPYLVMEYVDGVALARIALEGRRAGEPMPAELVAFVCARAAEGLHAAHALTDESGRSLDIVHRDVTPSNILVGFDGSVKITDFGIAKATGKSSHTRTGIIKGKIAYMSPEYAARKPVDGRADLYSLGIVLFELLAGKVPFDAKGDLELLKLVAYASPPTLASAVPDIDPELAGIVDGLLAKSPADRPPTGVELARKLDAWLAARGKQREDLEAALVAYARRHAGTAHKKLARMLEEDASTVPGDSDAPKRPRFETRTLLLFKRPSRREPEPREEPDEARPRTRRVAVSGYPPPPSEPVAAPASLPTPMEAALEPVARLSQPPPLTTARARHSSAVVGGVIAGSLAALLLVVLSVLATGKRRVEPASASQPAPIRPATVAPVPLPEPPLPEPLLSAESLPLEPELAATASTSKPKPLPGAGKPKPSAAKVPVTSKGTKPCTPDSFDYPGCLKR
ncbi:MAG: protein kinase [Polyangiaceae bacterium]|nr:protein kinase [Polyangiaceae bacterium]MCL4750047.1 protein kinase [Myxococcales bacterium]